MDERQPKYEYVYVGPDYYVEEPLSPTARTPDNMSEAAERMLAIYNAELIRRYRQSRPPDDR